jgi:hypothetical protein
VTLPLLTPIIAVVMTFSVLFTFTDFQLIYVLTRGGPLNATHLMATLSFQRAISGGALGEGAALATLMVPFLMARILFSYFGCQRRSWQQGGSDRMTLPMNAQPLTMPTRSRHTGMGLTSRRRARASHVCAAAVGVPVRACCSRSTGWSSPDAQAERGACCRARAIRSG